MGSKDEIERVLRFIAHEKKNYTKSPSRDERKKSFGKKKRISDQE